MNAFTRGFASVLCLAGDSSQSDLSFEYQGREIGATEVDDDLMSDWLAVVGRTTEEQEFEIAS